MDHVAPGTRPHRPGDRPDRRHGPVRRSPAGRPGDRRRARLGPQDPPEHGRARRPHNEQSDRLDQGRRRPVRRHRDRRGSVGAELEGRRHLAPAPLTSAGSCGSACRTARSAAAAPHSSRTRPRTPTRTARRRPGTVTAARRRTGGRPREAPPPTRRSTAGRSRTRRRRQPSPRAPCAVPRAASPRPCPQGQRSAGTIPGVTAAR